MQNFTTEGVKSKVLPISAPAAAKSSNYANPDESWLKQKFWSDFEF